MRAEEIGVFGTLMEVVKSDTSNREYEIRWNKETGYWCECQGWSSSRKTPKSCKHVKRVEFKHKLGEKLTDFSNRGFVGFQSEGAAEGVALSILELAQENWGV